MVGDGSEHSEQSAIIDWAKKMAYTYPELSLLFAIPNGASLSAHTDRRGRRFSPQASKLKAEGLRAGVPDLCLPVARQGFHGMFIELKVGKGKPSPEQVKIPRQPGRTRVLRRSLLGRRRGNP